MKEKREQTYKQKFIIFLKNPVKKVVFLIKIVTNLPMLTFLKKRVDAILQMNIITDNIKNKKMRI